MSENVRPAESEPLKDLEAQLHDRVVTIYGAFDQFAASAYEEGVDDAASLADLAAEAINNGELPRVTAEQSRSGRLDFTFLKGEVPSEVVRATLPRYEKDRPRISFVFSSEHEVDGTRERVGALLSGRFHVVTKNATLGYAAQPGARRLLRQIDDALPKD